MAVRSPTSRGRLARPAEDWNRPSGASYSGDARPCPEHRKSAFGPLSLSSVCPGIRRVFTGRSPDPIRNLGELTSISATLGRPLDRVHRPAGGPQRMSMTLMRGTIPESRQDGQLPRVLGPVAALCVIVGSVIGSGIFIVPARVAREVPAIGPILILWAVAGIFSLAGALTMAELAAMLPKRRRPVCLSPGSLRAAARPSSSAGPNSSSSGPDRSPPWRRPSRSISRRSSPLPVGSTAGSGKGAVAIVGGPGRRGDQRPGHETRRLGPGRRHGAEGRGAGG